MINILSLGAGVQSSTMALMAAAGELTPMPDAAIFADTQGEPASVYKWLDWLETQLPFPVYRVTHGNLETSVLDLRKTKDGRLFPKTNIPMFTRNEDGSQGKIRFRSCTADYKIKPIRRKQKELAGIRRGQKTIAVTTWIGISTDEAVRMKDSRDAWCVNRWPLIEARMSREDCLKWMLGKGFPEPPRSSCVFCPYHNNAEWQRLKTDEPEDFQRAVAFEQTLQAGKAASDNFRSVPFLHRSLVNIDRVDFTIAAKDAKKINHFQNECEGICGV